MRQTKKVYDAASQVIEERRGVGTAAEQAYASFGYTANGKQAWIKDAKLNQTSYSYDGYDRLEKTTFPDATYEELAYTITDTVASKRTRGNQLIVNTYDVMDRLVTHLVPQPGAAPAILTSTAYDAAGRPTSIGDDTGHSLAYTFDSAKRVVAVTQSAPTFSGTRVVGYTFDAAGNKTRTTWADGYYVQYQYDALNRMTTAAENGTFVLATYIYDPLSRRTSLVYGNGAAQGYTYSSQGDLLTLASTMTGTSNTTTNTFTKAHQLASEATSNPAWGYVPAAFQTTNYAAANNLNQYVNITVGANPTATLGYDANGNLTSDGTWTFAYDAANMLRSSTSAANTSTYQYDPLGRRQMLTENSTTTTFLHDGDEEIADYASSTLLRRFVPGPGTDMPIAMVTPSGGSNGRTYFHANRQGSTIAMSADDGTLAEGPYTYDAYGNGAPATGVPFKYTGRRLDAGTGLYYYRARYYSANLGRFLQTDPIGYKGGINLYGYSKEDPLNLTDPQGTNPIVLGGRACASNAACRALAIQALKNGTSPVLVGLYFLSMKIQGYTDAEAYSKTRRFEYDLSMALSGERPRPYAIKEGDRWGGTTVTVDDELDQVFDDKAPEPERPQDEDEADAIRDAVKNDTGEIEMENLDDPNHRGEYKMRTETDDYWIHYYKDKVTGATYGGKIVRRFPFF